jgi:hypothetical protein
MNVANSNHNIPLNSENLIMEPSWYSNPGLLPSLINNLIYKLAI